MSFFHWPVWPLSSSSSAIGNITCRWLLNTTNLTLDKEKNSCFMSCTIVHIIFVCATCSHGTIINKKVLLIWSYSATISPRQLPELTFLLVFLRSVRQEENLPISASSEVRMDKWQRLHESLDFFLFFSSCLK